MRIRKIAVDLKPEEVKFVALTEASSWNSVTQSSSCQE